MRLGLLCAQNDARSNLPLFAFFAFAGIAAPLLAARAGAIGIEAAIWMLLAFGVTTIPVMSGFWCVGAEKMFGTMRVLCALAVSRTRIVHVKIAEAAIFSALFVAIGAAAFYLAGEIGEHTFLMLLELALPAAVMLAAIATSLNFMLSPQAALIGCLLTAFALIFPAARFLLERFAAQPSATSVLLAMGTASVYLASVAAASAAWGRRDDPCR